MDIHDLLNGDQLDISDEAQTSTTFGNDDMNVQSLLATVERLEARARANAERLRNAIADLEMELRMAEPTVNAPSVMFTVASVDECKVK